MSGERRSKVERKEEAERGYSETSRKDGHGRMLRGGVYMVYHLLLGMIWLTLNLGIQIEILHQDAQVNMADIKLICLVSLHVDHI